MEQYLFSHPLILFLIILWVLPWKGVALWKSAQNNQKWWFISMLVINTMGILPIIYIFYFSNKKSSNEPNK